MMSEAAAELAEVRMYCGEDYSVIHPIVVDTLCVVWDHAH